MAIQITIDQAGKSAGIPGRAREDLALGTPVQLSVVGSALQYQWLLNDRPIDIVAQVRSAAALQTAASATTLLLPVDVAGTYRVSLAVDTGSGLGANPEDNASITFYAGPTLNADPTSAPRRVPAVGETIEHNVPDAMDPGGNPDGWGREWLKWFASIAASSGDVAATPDTIAKRGASGEGQFVFLNIAESSPAASVGSVRLTNLGSIAARNAADTGNVNALIVDNADAVVVGDVINSPRVVVQSSDAVLLTTAADLSTGVEIVNTPSLQFLIAGMPIKVSSSTTTFSLSQNTRSGTGANAGVTLPIAAQAGQQQSGSNANNNGGTLSLASGAAGTGGSGAPGSAGTVVVQCGASPRMTCSAVGIGFFSAAPVAQAARAGQLTDSTAGTPGATLAAVGGVTYTTDIATIRNWAASLAQRVNALETIIYNLGLSA